MPQKLRPLLFPLGANAREIEAVFGEGLPLGVAGDEALLGGVVFGVVRFLRGEVSFGTAASLLLVL